MTFTLVDGFKVYDPVPNNTILGAMGLPILRAYARHYGLALSHDEEELRAELSALRGKQLLPSPKVIKGLGPAPVARAGEVIRAKPLPVPKPEAANTPSPVSPQKTAAPAAPRVEPITVALWQQGAGQVSDLLRVRWTQENAHRLCKDFRLGEFKDLPHFLACLHEAARLHGLVGKAASGPEPVSDDTEEEEEVEGAPAPPPQVYVSPDVRVIKPKAPKAPGMTPEERAACERTGLGVVQYRLLTCLADGEARSYREIEKFTGYYSILTAELRKGKPGSLGDRGLVEEELRDEDPTRRPVLTFRITPAGLSLLRR